MGGTPEPDLPEQALAEIKLMVREDLYRAFQRCVWMQIHESGRTQLELMEELVQDFLRKYEC